MNRTLQTMTPKQLDNRGFTLIEILVAMAVFSIGILAVAAMQGTTVRNNAGSRGVTDIASCATARVEELMRLDWDDAELAAGTHSIAVGNVTADNDLIDNNYNGTIDENGETGPLTVEWVVTIDQPIRNTKLVVVTVRISRANINKRVSISRVIPRIV